MKLITVYGSLLEGLGNWKWHLDNPESKKLGEHVIVGKFQMISMGGFPGLIPDETMSEPRKIFVETYEVTDRVYNSIERLEGYPHFYGRTPIETPFGPSAVYTLSGSRYGAPSNDILVPEDSEGIVNWRNYYLNRGRR